MNQPTILIADDDAFLRDLYVRKLSQAGFRPVTVSDGAEAIEVLQRDQPALMLCDVHMLRIDGFEVLRRFPRAKRTFPIVMLTNFSDEEAKKTAADLGADGYLVKKNMTLLALIETVQGFLAA